MTDINSIGNARLIIREVSKVIVGKDESLIKILLAIISGGHILMEDIPGVGKTTMAISVSRALGLDYNRVQFTPDVLPSDITGFSIYDKETGKMNYQKGAGAGEDRPAALMDKPRGNRDISRCTPDPSH